MLIGAFFFFVNFLIGVIHKRCPQDWGKRGQEESDTCRHGGEGVSSKSGRPHLVQKFKYLIARSR